MASTNAPRRSTGFSTSPLRRPLLLLLPFFLSFSSEKSAFAQAAAQSQAQTTTPVPAPDTSATPLARQIATLLADPAARRAHWGIAVTALDGRPLYSLNSDQLFRPASTAKLFTTATAITFLGPTHRPETKVIAEGTLTGDTLHGNLVLQGGGDANLAGANPIPYSRTHSSAPSPNPLADLDALAQAVAAKGVRVIDGDVIGDDTAFADGPYPEGWSTDDLLAGYGAPVSALTLHDNLIDLTVTPATSGGPATVTQSPDVPYYRIDPQIPMVFRSTNAAGGVISPESPAPAASVSQVFTGASDTHVEVQRPVNSLDLFVTGDVRRGGPAAHEQIAIADPAAYAAAAFRAALQRQGIVVQGVTRPRHHEPGGDPTSFLSKAGKPDEEEERWARSLLSADGTARACHPEGNFPSSAPPRTVLATHQGPPLAEDLVLTLKTSQNLHAELMLRSLANPDCDSNSWARSAQIVRSFLTVTGIDNGDYVFYDGSGLSTKDLVTPRAATTLLAFATKQTWFPQWFAGLPVGGVDGTLSSRFTDPPLKGHVFAKTGTLGESRALAGYLDARSGRRVIFAIFVDNHTPGSSADRAVMDRIVAAIAAAN